MEHRIIAGWQLGSLTWRRYSYSMKNIKRRFVLLYRNLSRFDIVDMGKPRALSEPFAELVERFLLALYLEFHRMTRRVADPARQSELLGEVPGKKTETDAVHPSRNRDCQPFLSHDSALLSGKKVDNERYNDT